MSSDEFDPYADASLSPFAPSGGPVHIPSLTADELDALLSDLEIWTSRLIDRFEIDHRTLPPCWPRHLGMVEALAALRDFERATFTDTSSPAAGVDWLRAVREVTHFLRDLAALTGCTATEHRTRTRVGAMRARAGGAPASRGAPEGSSLP